MMMVLVDSSDQRASVCAPGVILTVRWSTVGLLGGRQRPRRQVSFAEAPSVASGKQGQRYDLDWTDQQG